MFHDEGISNIGPFVKSRTLSLLLILLAVFTGGCSGDTVVLSAPRFAQVGELRADVQVPLSPSGRLEGTIVWQSDGRWTLVERIYHRNALGAEVSRSSSNDSRALSAAYASLVQKLNEGAGLRLTGGQVLPFAGPCTPDQTSIRFSMVDAIRNEIQTWDRCARGNLFTLTAVSAGPDVDAARIVTAVQLIRSFTIGDLERSVFEGSLPFATVRSGAGGGSLPVNARAFRSDNGEAPPEWLEFWASYAAAGASEPDIVWNEEMVLLMVDGDRREAGHQLRVRRVLPVGALTLIETVEEVPGDFCAPAAITERPFHLVRVPQISPAIQFGQPVPLRLPCGR